MSFNLITRSNLLRTSVGFAVGLAFVTAAARADGQSAGPRLHAVECSVYPAVPDRLEVLWNKSCHASQNEQIIVLQNGFVSVEIPADAGVIARVENKLTG